MIKEISDTNDIFFDLNDFIAVLKMRWKLLFIIYLGLLGLTFIYSSFKKPVYQTSFTLTSTQLSTDVKEIVENFNLLYGADGIYRKSNVLSADMLNLKQIEVQNIDIDKSTETTLKIRMLVYNTASISNIVQALISYCNNNKYLIKKRNAEKEKTRKIIEQHKNQLNELNLYKQNVEKENYTFKSMSYYNVYKDVATFQETITTLEYDLLQLKGFEVLVEPIDPIKPTGLSLAKSLIIATVFGLILCAFIVFFLDKLLAITKKIVV